MLDGESSDVRSSSDYSERSGKRKRGQIGKDRQYQRRRKYSSRRRSKKKRSRDRSSRHRSSSRDRRRRDSSRETLTSGSISDKHSRSIAEFEDISEWGRTAVPEFYAFKGKPDSKDSLSSGLTPRERFPAKREWASEEAYRSLAHRSLAYGAAAAIPGGSYNGDDLPTRVAYEHLRALAGMAGKVQDAILHNKLVFEKRIIHQEQAECRNALLTWHHVLIKRQTKQNILARAVRRISRSIMFRVFDAWRNLISVRDRTTNRLKKVLANAFLRWCVTIICFIDVRLLRLREKAN